MSDSKSPWWRRHYKILVKGKLLIFSFWRRTRKKMTRSVRWKRRRGASLNKVSRRTSMSPSSKRGSACSNRRVKTQNHVCRRNTISWSRSIMTYRTKTTATSKAFTTRSMMSKRPATDLETKHSNKSKRSETWRPKSRTSLSRPPLSTMTISRRKMLWRRRWQILNSSRCKTIFRKAWKASGDLQPIEETAKSWNTAVALWTLKRIAKPKW